MKLEQAITIAKMENLETYQETLNYAYEYILDNQKHNIAPSLSELIQEFKNSNNMLEDSIWDK